MKTWWGLGLVCLLVACEGASEIACDSDRVCSGSGMVCELTRGVCVECVIDGDCLDPDQVCRANRCTTVTPCRSSRECSGLVCATDLGYCVECLTDVDCTDGQVCSDDHFCVAPPTRCVSDRDCGEFGQVCDTTAGLCVACVRAADCAPGQACVDHMCRMGVDSGFRFDAGDRDAGIRTDGGDRDGGASVDAGMPVDGGFTFDAGGTDAGGADAGVLPCDAACLCARAVSDNLMTGCEYWPVVTPNSSLDPEFGFGVLITNDESLPATIEVRRMGVAVVATATVAANSSQVVALPRIPEFDFSINAVNSVRLDNAAYRLRSTVPVSVTQMNALQSRIPMDCAAETTPADFTCNAYSIDASRLLPAHRFGTSYRAVTWPTLVVEQLLTYFQTSAFIAVVAPTATTVTIQASSNFAASSDGTTILAIPASGSTAINLAAGSVLILASAQPSTCSDGVLQADGFTSYCDAGFLYDPTGTRITSTQPVEVLSGHDCAFVPFSVATCDHLEAALFPVPALGQRHVVSRTTPLATEPNMVRIVSQVTSNTITFTPAISAPRVLGVGGSTELEVSQDVMITGTGAFTVSQSLVGALYSGGAATDSDPAMTVLQPDSAWRRRVAFMSPSGFSNSLGLVTSPGATVRVDGAIVGSFTSIVGTPFAGRQLVVGAGHHVVESSAPIQVTTYGYDSFASYLTIQ